MGKLLEVVDHRRGCGTRVKGGCYLDSTLGAGGAIMPGVWVLDWCRADADTQFVVKTPPRATLEIDPLASLLMRQPVPVGTLPDLTLSEAQRHLIPLGRYGLLDHVGESNYTPWAFFQELRRHGPSRKVPARFAAAVAKRLPVPILFTMPLPLVSDAAAARALLIADGQDPDRYAWTPTWENPRWTFLTRKYDGGPKLPNPYYGDDHFETAVLQWADALEPAERKRQGWTWAEMPFALALITRCTYICKDDEDGLPEALRGSGVQPARLIAPEEDDDES